MPRIGWIVVTEWDDWLPFPAPCIYKQVPVLIYKALQPQLTPAARPSLETLIEHSLFLFSRQGQLSFLQCLHRVPLTEQLANGLELDVTGTLVDSRDLAVSPVLCQRQIPSESHTTGPLDRITGNLLSNHRSVIPGTQVK